MLHDCVECLCAIFTGWRSATGCRSQTEQQAYLDRYARELLAAFRQHKVRTGAEISRGLEVARQQDTDFLPNPGRFARWCKEKQHPSHRAFKRLDHVPDWDAGLERIRELKRNRAERNAA